LPVYLCLRVYVFFMFFCTVILTKLSMFCVRLSHFIINFEFELRMLLLYAGAAN